MSYAAGAGDAFAFSQLGAVFTANMTGSLVLAGLTSQPAYGALLSGTATTLGAFLLAVYTASRVAPKRPVPNWRGIVGVLWAVVALNVALLVMVCVSPHPGSALRLVMLAASAAAMGAQTAAAKRYEPASGVTTTFVTGTLTSIAQDAADGSTRYASFRAGLVIMLVLGALTTSGALFLDLRLGPAVVVVATAAAALAFPMHRGPQPGAHR
ncbi:DUF1275 family protein [Streptomyces sp. NPDC059582]|uniref:DUF1275 family protein n=1 Tax=Streptomyces sp. NPDC059582 TaxID=3346875 RepID=UPI0036CC8C60